MKIEERQKIVKEIMQEVLVMAKTKGHDYSGIIDCLNNFKVNAERAGLTKYQIWQVYFNKHIDAINNAIKMNSTSPYYGTKSESLHGRIIDAITYLTLLECMINEDIK